MKNINFIFSNFMLKKKLKFKIRIEEIITESYY